MFAEFLDVFEQCNDIKYNFKDTAFQWILVLIVSF